MGASPMRCQLQPRMHGRGAHATIDLERARSRLVVRVVEKEARISITAKEVGRQEIELRNLWIVGWQNNAAVDAYERRAVQTEIARAPFAGDRIARRVRPLAVSLA